MNFVRKINILKVKNRIPYENIEIVLPNGHAIP